MIDDLVQAAMLITGAIAFLLVCRGSPRAKWGWLIGLLGQPLWLYTTWRAGQWGMFALSCVYAYGWIEGVWNHWRQA